MSQQLSRISNTCPIFDKLKDEVEEIRNDYLEEDYVYSDSIEQCLNLIIDYADEIRNTAGELRDTASDIASSKNEEIDELEKEKKDLLQEIEDLKEELADTKYELREQFA